MWERLMSIDRRIIFALVFVIVAFGLLNPMGLPIPVGYHAQRHFDTIEALPDGGVIVLDCAYSPGSDAELGPMVEATAHHAFRKDMKIILFNMHWELGPELGHQRVSRVAEIYGKEYGVDWVNLGFQAGGAPVNLQAAVRSFAEARPTDWAGRPLSDLPVMDGIERLHPDYVDHVIVYSSGNPGSEDYLRYVIEPTGLTFSVGSIQMSIANELPFVDAGQMASVIPGGRGGAEYELLVEQPGGAIAVQDVLSLAALFVTLILILGNLGYYMTRKEN